MRTPIDDKPSIERLKRRGDVWGLIEALGYRHSLRVRKEACRALVGVGGRAVLPVADALEHRDRYVRRWAARALGDIGDKRATRRLLAALRDQDILVCHAAVEALSGIPGTSNRTWDAIRIARRRCEKARQLVDAGDERGIDHIISHLFHDDWVERWGAAAKLRRIGGPRVVLPLVAALRDEHRRVRMASVRALGWIRDPRAVDSLLFMLDGQDIKLRRFACWALGNIGDSLAVEGLILSLYDRESEITRAAARALGRIGDRRAVGALIALAHDEDSEVRRAIASALEQIKRKHPAEVIEHADWDEDPAVRYATVEALLRHR